MWVEIEKELRKIGLIGIESMDHLNHFREWENDDIQLEKRIAAVLKQFKF